MRFDPEKYIECIKRTLHTSRDVLKDVRTPRILSGSGGWPKWEVITWGARFEWDSGHKFEVEDFFSNRKKNILRLFSYHFMGPDSECIFRFDTHGVQISADRSCHLHIGEKEKIFEDDDANLHGFGLSQIDFIRAYGLVNHHLKGKRLPWE